MKVTSPTSGRTTPALLARDYQRPVSNAGQAGQEIARGLTNLGQSMIKYEGVIKERDDKTNRFNALKGLSEFQTAMNEDLINLKRDYAADGKDFAKTAEVAYDKKSQEFLANIPADLQEDIGYRLAEIKGGVVSNSLDFQYKAGDAWFKQGVSDELNKSKQRVSDDPTQMDVERARMRELIAETDLAEIEKEGLARNIDIALESITFKKVKKDNAVRDQEGDPSRIVDKIIGVESTNNPDAKNPNSSAEGLGQFIDSTWIGMLSKHRQDLTGGMTTKEIYADPELKKKLLALKADPALSREMTVELTKENQKYLARAGVSPNEQNTYLAHFLGQRDAVKVAQANPDTPVDGLITPDSIAANQSVLAGKTAGEVRAWASRKMKVDPTDSDPRFANIPFEDKLALSADAETEASKEYTELLREQKAMLASQRNALEVGLLDGTKGQMDIDNARAAGTLTDYEDIKKVQNILAAKNKEVNLQQALVTKLATPGAVFDSSSKDDKDMLNAGVKDGLKNLTAMDEGYVTQGILPLVQRAGDIPTTVAGTLTGMLNSSNQSQALFALDSFAQLQDANKAAFNLRTNADTAKAVDLYQALKDVVPRDELLRRIRGGATEAERQQQRALGEEASTLLNSAKDGVTGATRIVNNILAANATGLFGLGGAPDPSAIPMARIAMENEVRTLFTEAYSKTGNEAAATELVKKTMERSWSVTNVGMPSLMKWAPEKVGYPPVAGTYDWINEQATQLLGLQANEKFALMSDTKTVQEYQAFQRGETTARLDGAFGGRVENAPLPSYQVAVIDEMGVARIKMTPEGKVARIRFDKPEDALQKESDLYDWNDRNYKAEMSWLEYNQLKRQAQLSGQPLSMEDKKVGEAAWKELELLRKTKPKGAPVSLFMGTMPLEQR